MKKGHPARTTIKRVLAILMMTIMVAGLLPDTLSGVLTAWADDEASITLTRDGSGEIRPGDEIKVKYTISGVGEYSAANHNTIYYTMKKGDTVIENTAEAADGYFTIETDAEKVKDGGEYTVSATAAIQKLTDDGAVEYIPISSESSGNLTVTISKLKYTVTYIVEGSEVKEADYNYDEPSKVEAYRPVNASKDGYTFHGWYADPEYKEGYNAGSELTHDLSLYGYYEYRVTINNANGSATTEKYYKKGAEVSKPDTPTRNGYVLKEGYGWLKDGTEISNNNFPVKVTIPMTLQANWVRLHTVTFETGSHVKEGVSAPEQTLITGKKVRDPFAGRKQDEIRVSDDYEFTGWKKRNSDGSLADELYNFDHEVKDEEGDFTLAAVWKVKISFADDPDMISSTTMNEVTPVYVDENNGKLSSVPAATKEGYTQSTDNSGSPNWYTDIKDDTTKVTTDTEFTRPTTVYTKFSADKYTITFNSNVPDDTTKADGTMSDQEFTFDAEQKLTKNIFARSDDHPKYKFLGWSTDKDASAAAYTDEQSVKNLTSDKDGKVTLYAVWQVYTYKVKFDANDSKKNYEPAENKAAGEMTEQTITFDESTALAANTFNRTGLEFAGWSTVKDGGTWYTDGEEVNNLAEDKNQEITLYAQWKDTTAPSIEYTARSAGRDEAKKAGIAFDKYAVLYTFTIKDVSGVDKDSIEYFVSEDKELSESDLQKESFEKAYEVVKNGDEYEFSITAPRKGYVYVRAADKADNPQFDSTEDGSKEGLTYESEPNTAYVSASALVVEHEAPAIEVTVDSNKVVVNNEADGVEMVGVDPGQGHDIIIGVTDKPETKYSGLQKITYELYQSKGDGSTERADDAAAIAASDGNTATNEREVTAQTEFAELKKNETVNISYSRSQNLNGYYVLEVNALDNCGNTLNTPIAIPLTFSNSAPEIRFSLSEGGNQDTGEWYYNDNISGLEFKVGDKDKNFSEIKSFTVTVTNESGKATTFKEKAFDLTKSDGNRVWTGTLSAGKLKSLGAGKLSITAEVTDKTGNSTQGFTAKDVNIIQTEASEDTPIQTTAEFIYDNDNPVATVEMTDGYKDEEDGLYYYNSNNVNVEVTLGDTTSITLNGYTIAVKNTDTGNSITETLTSSDATNTSRSIVRKINDKETATTSEYNNPVVKFTNNELSVLGEGHFIITIEAKDKALNSSNKITAGEGVKISDDTKAEFCLDDTAPAIAFTLTGGSVDNGLYYYRDDISDLAFTIGENDNKASRIRDFTITITNLDAGGAKTISAADYEGSTDSGIYEDGTISAEDLKKLGAGHFSITAWSRDRCGNETKVISTYNGLTEEPKTSQEKETVLQYYLDTGNPKITVSADGGNQDVTTGNWYHNASDTLIFNLTSDDEGKNNSANFKEFTVTIHNEDKDTTLTKTLKTENDKRALAGDDKISAAKNGNDSNPNTGGDANTNNETLTLKLEDIKDQLGEGTINITATATDLSNNTTSVFTVASDRTLNYADENATASFIFDYTAPAIRVSMGGTDGHGDTGDSHNFFYKADNADITVDLGTDTDRAELQSYTVTVSDSGEGDAKKTLTETLTDGSAVKHTGKEDGTIDPATTKTITFTTKEVAALADGKITVTVTAADYATNDSDLSGKNDAAVTVTNLIHDETEATFTLDTVAPVLTEINTSVAGQGPYDEDEDYYYKKDDNTTTKFTIADVNCYTMSIGYKKDGEDQTAVSADTYADNVTLDYNGFTDGKYTGIKLYAHDKAGNALALGEKYTPAQTEDRDAVDNGDGTVSVTHNRIVDSVAPIATITYSSDARAYLYGGETGDNYKEGTAYINRNLSTQVQISDQYGTTGVALDAAKLTVTENGTAYDNDNQYESGSYDETRTVSAEGSYIYSVFGTDRAGNPVTVQEEGIKSGIGSAEKLSNSQDYKSTENCGTAYNSRYRITIDKTSPTFSFDLPKVSGNETVDGTTAYYGSVHRSLVGTFMVSEINFDSSRLGAGYVSKSIGSGSRYNQQSLSFTAGDLEHGWSTSGRISTLTKTIGTAEGIYMYEIQGCDKAGNPVVKSSAESAKNDYTEMTAHGSDAFISHYKVIDTTAPTGTLDIGSYYHVTMNRGGSNTLRTSGYSPYREETHATINIAGSDQSPIRIGYDIVSTIANTRSFDQNYANDNRTSSSVSGEQVFNIANLILMDRAGNRSGFINKGQTSANKIYLDVTPPANYDVEKPVATITSTTKVTRRSADGRDLYNRGVSLGLKVVDPGSRVRSAGLDSIHYTVKADGRTIVDETVDKNSAKAPLYNETSLDYEWSLDLPIHSGGVYETNDIVVTVDAVDNAGNKADTVTYKFGIDTVGPEITVTYDNNSAQHDKYFKENRTATVTVLDRNVDDGKISIKTEAGVPRGYSYASGGGNGREDIWTKKISYAADGDYTLNISGTDALGNKATVKYVGTATQDFTIDKTKPVITVTFDNNDVRNGKYYKDVRNATVSINEHNFLASEVKIIPSASIQSGRGSQPTVRTGGFGGSGDRRAANVGFLDDGNYSMVVDYTDMAGNEAQQVVVDEFVVDTTAPTIKFNDIPEINGGDVAPIVTVDDTNFSADLFNMVIAGVRRRDHKLAFGTAFGAYGGTASFRNIEVRKENDDFYTITAAITDLAGNESEATLKFSVNRFGSTFDYGSKETRSLVGTYYANKEKEVQLVENNVNKLTSHTVLLYWNGEIRTLVEGTDYTVEENPVTGGYSYVYKLNSDNFSGEGIYNVVIQSEDEAGNKNTNSSVKIDGGTESVPVEFQIDKTLPTSLLGGFDTDKYQFNASSLDIDVKPTDDVKLASVRITRYDSSGNALGDPVYYSYDEAEIASGRAQDLSKVLDSDGWIAYTVEGYNRDQYLEVATTDAASNNSDDHTYSEPEDGRGVIRGTAQRMLVTGNLVAHYTHTPWMIIMTVAVPGLVIFLFFWKRRKDDEHKNQAMM